MTNSPDDTGQRPPPPRAAEQAPPLGGPGHAPPQRPLPGQAPPPQGAPFQQGQPLRGAPLDRGGPPPPPTGFEPGYPPVPQPQRPKTGRKGFFGSLFDLSFDHSVTLRLATFIYAMIILVNSLMALLIFFYGVDWYFLFNRALGVMAMIAAPVGWVFNLVMARVFMEFVINQFKISEHLKVIRDRGGLR